MSRIDGKEGSLVRLTGTVEADCDLIEAPFSGVNCVVLRASVEERRFGSFLFPTYLTIHDPSRSRPFVLRTPHTTVPVDAPARTVVPDPTVLVTVGPAEAPPDRIARYERGTDGLAPDSGYRSPPAALVSFARALLLGTRRYVERRLSPGETVTVVGRVVDGRVDPLVAVDGSPARALLRLSKTSVAGLLVGLFAAALGVLLLVG